MLDQITATLQEHTTVVYVVCAGIFILAVFKAANK
jgi:hypothetical protein